MPRPKLPPSLRTRRALSGYQPRGRRPRPAPPPDIPARSAIDRAIEDHIRCLAGEPWPLYSTVGSFEELRGPLERFCAVHAAAIAAGARVRVLGRRMGRPAPEEMFELVYPGGGESDEEATPVGRGPAPDAAAGPAPPARGPGDPGDRAQ